MTLKNIIKVIIFISLGVIFLAFMLKGVNPLNFTFLWIWLIFSIIGLIGFLLIFATNPTHRPKSIWEWLLTIVIIILAAGFIASTWGITYSQFMAL